MRVLNLDPPLARALANRPVQLRGFVRGLGKVRLERQVNGGTWTTVKRVRTRPDGRFTVTVTAAADDELPARDAGRSRAARSPSQPR